MSDKIREETGYRIVDLLRKSNLNLKTNMLDKKSDQRLDKIIEEGLSQWVDNDD